MNILIKPMESDAEIQGKAYVHWKAWLEAYTGLIDTVYLDREHTLEKCTDIAFRWRDNLLVAKDGQRVVGFVGYGPASDGAFPEVGEVYALYILREYYGQKVGRALMSAAMEELSGCKSIVVWVLKGNQRAIRFYEKCGFRSDGTQKEIVLGTANTELRMIYENAHLVRN